MKNSLLFFLIFKLFILISVSRVLSSPISCSYIFNGESYPLVFEINENTVLEKSSLRGNIVHQILSSDEKYLMFGRRVKNKKFRGFQVVIINKLSGELVSTSLMEPEMQREQQSSTVYGRCIF